MFETQRLFVGEVTPHPSRLVGTLSPPREGRLIPYLLPREKVLRYEPDEGPWIEARARSGNLLACVGADGLIEDCFHGDFHDVVQRRQAFGRLLELLACAFEQRPGG